MSKGLELVGLALIAGTIISFVGLIPNVDAGANPVFWACAIGALGVILYRKRQRKKLDEQNSS